MTVNDLAKCLLAKKINIANGDRQISNGYCGDLLSFVMGKAPTNSAWFTVMTNINICAVASLADVACVVVCESCELSNDVIAKAKEQSINIIQTGYDIFNCVKRFINENQV